MVDFNRCSLNIFLWVITLINIQPNCFAGDQYGESELENKVLEKINLEKYSSGITNIKNVSGLDELSVNDDSQIESPKFSQSKRALQKSHEKPQDVKWLEVFLGKNMLFDQVPSLVNLVNDIATKYLSDCATIFLYDDLVEKSEGLLLEQLFRKFPIAYIHGQITNKYRVKNKDMLHFLDNKCVNYVMFVADVMKCKDVIGDQSINKVVVVARSSQWRVYEFLGGESAQGFVNLLVIAQSEKTSLSGDEMPFILYTHDLYIDGLGSSAPKVLTSWIRGSLTRPRTNLFPRKITLGFQGHRFIVALAHQPPFVVKRGIDDFDNIQWDGSEVRLINLLAELYNFTTDLREPKDAGILGPGDSVAKEIKEKKANIGLAGMYITQERLGKIEMSHLHSQDCAAFISLTSTALPRYRAIMGPFHWTVWLALTLTYLFAIFPIAFSDRHTLRHLIKNPEEIENMFWYVFGTFTNCFTFAGRNSWNKSTKVTTRLLVGFYWLFTIITTACYTGSIIAFVTLPVYPSTVDTVRQLLSGRYQIGTLDKGGWQYWFDNSSDPSTTKLLKDVELLPDVESGLKNTTKAFFWAYAFLGSRAQLDYIVRTNFTTTNKRSLLHISSECFVPYGVGTVFTMNSIYKNILNDGIMKAFQSGFMLKFSHDVEWEMMRSATGKLLQASSGVSLRTLAVEDRSLTLDDTQGMFLLLGAGFLLGGASLLSEWFGGCFNLCQRRRSPSAASIESNPRSYDTPTPREKLNSISYNCKSRLGSIIDIDPTNDANSKFSNSDGNAIHSNNIASVLVENNSHFDHSIEEEESTVSNLLVHSECEADNIWEQECNKENGSEHEHSEENDKDKEEGEMDNITNGKKTIPESKSSSKSDDIAQNLIDNLFDFHELFGEEVNVDQNSHEVLNEDDGEAEPLRN